MALRTILLGGEEATPIDIENLNKAAKAVKRFERDIRFVALLLSKKDSYEAIVAEVTEGKVKLWVDAWDRLVTSWKLTTCIPGDKVTMKFFCDPTQRSWKRRIVVDFDKIGTPPSHES